MRREFILPALLLAAMIAMVVYATTHTDADGPLAESHPAPCEAPALLARLPQLHEASGLTSAHGAARMFWTHNDSGAPIVYGLDADGRIRARVRVSGPEVQDWEAVLVAPCPDGPCLYIADIGDNAAERPHVTIYRTRAPAVTAAATAPVAVFRAVYPDGPQDAEALLFAGGALHIVTKGDGAPVRMYRVPPLSGTAPLVLQHVATLVDEEAPERHRITDAATSPDGRWIALRTPGAVWFYETANLLSGTPGAPFVADVRAMREPQGEGLAWPEAGLLYLAGEGEGGGTFGRLACALPR